MAAGKINLQANDGAVVGLVVPEGLGSGERQIALGVNLSGITAYHLLQGNLSVSNEVITNGFGIYTYTGNGSTQSVNTGIDMDTQWGNDASEKFGGLVWIKNRDTAAYNNLLFDTVIGSTNYIISNNTNAMAVGATMLTSFGNNGFTLGSYIEVNGTSKTNVSWNFQTTHRRTGTTNHGKAYTCHYNPFTGFTIVKYEGSGIVGHEIPHHLGRKLGLFQIKNLSAASSWVGTYNSVDGHIKLNETSAFSSIHLFSSNLNSVTMDYLNDSAVNTSTNQYIMYGWVNSYYDESDKLIGNYEIGVYQGTGVAGNKVTTRGKPAWIMIKRLDGVENWNMFDNQRVVGGYSNYLYSNLSAIEGSTSAYRISIVNDGFIPETNASVNASGGQYLYMVVYDNDSGSGKSKYPRATDSSQLQLNTALIPFANGIDSNGAKNTILSKNETITGLTYTAGKNYVYAKNDGTYGVKSIAPSYGKDNPLTGDFYNVMTNKWYSNTNSIITESRNYLDAIVHADANGQVAYVEELPKIEYKDIIKANEFRGKNACTAFASVSSGAIPLSIADSYNISSIIRIGLGVYKIYFKEKMDNMGYCVKCTMVGDFTQTLAASISSQHPKTTDSVTIFMRVSNGASYDQLADAAFDFEITGGKN